MANTDSIPARKDVPAEHRWNLSKLAKDEASWDAELVKFEAMIPGIEKFRGKLADSKEDFFAALSYNREMGLLGERLGYYAQLRVSEDEGDSASRGRAGRFMMAMTKAEGAAAWLLPELQRIPDAKVDAWLADPAADEYRVFVRKLLRLKPHVLSEAEERLLALQAEANETASDAFSVLTNVDIDFGTVDTPEGPKPLSQSAYSSFMQNPDRAIREAAYRKFYAAFDGHKNTIATLYSGSCKLDKYRATVRKYPSARAAALFPDDVSEAVYDNLVKTVNANLPTLHKYYEIRRKALKLPELRHWDVYVPLVPAAKSKYSYEEAVAHIEKALAPLGTEYVSTIKAGLLGGWVDRYENKGKRSGAFSAGSFSGDPYILMNYKDDVIRDMFTLAHEGGHSMHSWYSARNNPFLSYGYTIFEAEVASTFNEALLFDHMYREAKDQSLRTYLLNSRVDDLLATLFRQTMFAEFEMVAHAALEGGTPLTVDFFRAEYRKLLEKYFGPSMKFEEVSDLEGLRIPHFYGAFYVYKYSTGISASIALAKRVLSGGAKEREDYFRFLKSGGSRYPIEALKVAGVDMSTPQPIEAACAEFGRLVDELGKSLGV